MRQVGNRYFLNPEEAEVLRRNDVHPDVDAVRLREEYLESIRCTIIDAVEDENGNFSAIATELDEDMIFAPTTGNDGEQDDIPQRGSLIRPQWMIRSKPVPDYDSNTGLEVA